jgi:hypothetical protein
MFAALLVPNIIDAVVDHLLQNILQRVQKIISDGLVVLIFIPSSLLTGFMYISITH